MLLQQQVPNKYCGRDVGWVRSNNGLVVPGAIVAGTAYDGEALYIGRAEFNGNIIPGKVICVFFHFINSKCV